jgi:hypothetical protein
MTSFALSIDSLQVGQRPNTNICMIDSYIAKEDIEFGKPVLREVVNGVMVVKNWVAGTAADLAKTFAGISFYTQTSANKFYDDTTGSVISAGTLGNFMRFGDHLITASVAVVIGDACYIDVATGKFTNVATNNLKIGRFYTTTTAVDQPALIYLTF